MQRIRTGCVPLPSEAHDGVAVAEQPGVARIGRKVPIAAIDDRKNARASAIGYLQQQRTIAFARILWTYGDELGRELHLAILQVYGFFQIDNATVVWIRNRNREIDAAEDT